MRRHIEVLTSNVRMLKSGSEGPIHVEEIDAED